MVLELVMMYVFRVPTGAGDGVGIGDDVRVPIGDGVCAGDGVGIGDDVGAPIGAGDGLLVMVLVLVMMYVFLLVSWYW